MYKGGLASTSSAGLPGGSTDGIALGDRDSLWLGAAEGLPCESKLVEAMLIGADVEFSASTVGPKVAGNDVIGCFDREIDGIKLFDAVGAKVAGAVVIGCFDNGEADGIELREGFTVVTAEGVVLVLGVDVGSVYNKREKERSMTHSVCIRQVDLHCRHLPVVLAKPILTASM